MYLISSKWITYVWYHDSLDVINVLDRSGNKILVPLLGTVHQKEQLLFLQCCFFFSFFFLLKQCCFFFFLETNNVVSYLKRLCHTSIKVVVVVCNESTHRNSSQSFVMFNFNCWPSAVISSWLLYITFRMSKIK